MGHALHRVGQGVPFKYSLPDDVQFDTIDLTIRLASSATTTCSLQLVATYTREGNL